MGMNEYNQYTNVFYFCRLRKDMLVGSDVSCENTENSIQQVLSWLKVLLLKVIGKSSMKPSPLGNLNYATFWKSIH